MITDGIGLPATTTTQVKETADLRMLSPLTKRAAVLLLRLSNGSVRP